MRYIQGAIFASSYYIDKDNRQYRNFRDQFRMALGVTPEKWEMIGFAAVTLLYDVFSEGVIDRSSLQQKLLGLQRFRGIRGEYRLMQHNRVNDAVNLLQIESTGFKKLQ